MKMSDAFKKIREILRKCIAEIKLFKINHGRAVLVAKSREKWKDYCGTGL